MFSSLPVAFAVSLTNVAAMLSLAMKAMRPSRAGLDARASERRCTFENAGESFAVEDVRGVALAYAYFKTSLDGQKGRHSAATRQSPGVCQSTRR